MEFGFTESRLRTAVRKNQPDLPLTNPRDIGLTNPSVIESDWFRDVARRQYPETTAKYVDRFMVLQMYERHGMTIREVGERMELPYLTVYRWAKSFGLDFRSARTTSALGDR
jgi:hypothetical protein